MMRARELYAAVEADQAIQKALKARLFTDHTNINVNDWIYYRTNIDRYWKGPLKVVMKDGKRLYCIKHGNPVTINVDDVLLVKQGDEEVQMLEKFTMLGADQGQTEPFQSPDKTTIPVPDQIPTAEENIQSDQTPDHVPVISAKTSTAQLDIGVPMVCKICEEEFSSKLIAQHGQEEHNTGNRSVRSFSSLTDPQPDSLYANIDKIKPGDVMVEEGGRYLVLDHREEDDWIAHDLITKETEKLNVIKQMTKMRYIGQLEEETEEEIRVNKGGQVVHYNKDSFKQKLFFTSCQEKVQDQVFDVNIPRSRHGEKERADFDHFDVYEVGQAEYDNVISTESVSVEKEKSDCLVTGELEAVKEKMAENFDYGEIQQLPIRFLGINISQDQEGDITLDQEHYVKDLEVPDMDEIKSPNKVDILLEKFQSTFRSLASKINMLALSSRPYSLIKQTTLLDNKLLNTVRAGHYELPGGNQVRDSTRTSVKTWAQLIQAEQEAEHSS